VFNKETILATLALIFSDIIDKNWRRGKLTKDLFFYQHNNVFMQKEDNTKKANLFLKCQEVIAPKITY
jgi:hypothetical protein